MSPGGRTGWSRHLEGWPLGLWVVLVCVLSALLVVPRNVPPELLPPPRVDRIEQREERERDALRAERARAGLPVEVRSVGEAFRQYGHAARAARATLPLREAQLRRLAAEALERHGPERLLELRALQTELLWNALAQGSAEPAPEAVELAGGMLERGLAQGWFEPAPSGADRDELATLFRMYWSQALGLTRHPFAFTLNEWRAYYRFLLARPIPDAPERDGDLRRKLEYVAALGKHDQDYPVHLARGILAFWRGSPADAAVELRTHLERNPDGPWTLRARNHLAACGALLSE